MRDEDQRCASASDGDIEPAFVEYEIAASARTSDRIMMSRSPLLEALDSVDRDSNVRKQSSDERDLSPKGRHDPDTQ